MGGLIFLPNDATLSKILEVSTHNQSCQLDERIPLDDPKARPDAGSSISIDRCTQIPEFNPEICEYTLVVTHGLTRDIYTRNPCTGRVTPHTFPYPNLPPFKISANPWMVCWHSYGSARLTMLRHSLLKLAGQSMISGPFPSVFIPSRVSYLSSPPSPPSQCSSSSSDDELADAAPDGLDDRPDDRVVKWLQSVLQADTGSQGALIDDVATPYKKPRVMHAEISNGGVTLKNTIL